MFLWLHHLLNPHCPDCQLAAIENKVCQSCETLKLQLSISNAEKRNLLETLMSLAKPAEVQPSTVQVNRESIPKPVTWNVRRQMLEAEDRKQAQVLAEQRKKDEEAKKSFIAANPLPVEAVSPANIDDRKQSIEQLEKELGISQEVKESA